jgi:hypothetical protein
VKRLFTVTTSCRQRDSSPKQNFILLLLIFWEFASFSHFKSTVALNTNSRQQYEP